MANLWFGDWLSARISWRALSIKYLTEADINATFSAKITTTLPSNALVVKPQICETFKLLSLGEPCQGLNLDAS